MSRQLSLFPNDQRDHAMRVHRRLCAAYGCPLPFHRSQDPLSELVGALLSHRTRNADTGRAVRALRTRWPDWADVRDAPTAELAAVIAPCTWPELKASRLQAVLRAITARRGALSLDLLAEMSVPQARAWLESVPGVGPKTSACVLLFSNLRRPALPVDSHHHRVATRLGLLPPGTPVGPAHALLAAQLPRDFTAQELYDNHAALMLHGQRCCHYAEPACGRCPALDLCAFGQRRVAQPTCGGAGASAGSRGGDAR